MIIRFSMELIRIKPGDDINFKVQRGDTVHEIVTVWQSFFKLKYNYSCGDFWLVIVCDNFAENGRPGLHPGTDSQTSQSGCDRCRGHGCSQDQRQLA